MENRDSRGSRTHSRGLIGILGSALVGAASLLPAGKADGGTVSLVSDFGTTTAPDTFLYHVPNIGATDNYDAGIDTGYTVRSPPVVNFFSQIPGYNLSRDLRGVSSLTPFNTKLQGNGLSYPAGGTLNFVFSDAKNDFGTLPIWADIYKNRNLVEGNIDVRTDTASRALSLASNSDFYNVNVRFSVLGDANLDRKVDAADASILAANWGWPINKGDTSPPYNPADFNQDGYVNTADARIMATNWGYGCNPPSESAGANIPEPSTFTGLLGLLAGATLLGSRRDRN